MEVLSDGALNRATLARQLLLARSSLDPLSAIEHLVGLQAQVPTNPHMALWARLDGFDTDQLDALLMERRVVRSAALRGTDGGVWRLNAVNLPPGYSECGVAWG